MSRFQTHAFHFLATFTQLVQVLTDIICSKCSKVPVMRSPSSSPVKTSFCVNCDDAPSTSNEYEVSASTHRPPRVGVELRSASSNSIGSLSRASTPPTEVSEAPSSPVFAPILDTADLMRRRQQSDTASAEIGRRMLKGWAMLADECPNSQCYGIPLVRRPKNGTAVDPRKASVISNVYGSPC